MTRSGNGLRRKGTGANHDQFLDPTAVLTRTVRSTGVRPIGYGCGLVVVHHDDVDKPTQTLMLFHEELYLMLSTFARYAA